MSNAIVKAALNNLADIKTVFLNYATKGKAGEVGNPFWSLYQGEDTKAPRIAYNWHLSDVDKAWSLLEDNLKPYANTGGTFYLTMSDKAKDNAPSIFRLIDFNQFRNVQPQGSINGMYTMQQQGGYDQRHIDEKIELAMLRKEVQDMKTGKNSSNAVISGLISPFVSNPNFDPNAFFNGVFYFLGNLVGGGQKAVNGVPPQYFTQTAPPPPPTEQAAQAEQTETDKPYVYDNQQLLYGLEKIRAKVKGVKTETVIVRVGDMLENMQPLMLQGLLSQLGIQYDPITDTCKDLAQHGQQ